MARGCRSARIPVVGAFPFRRGGTPAGTLNVYAAEPGFADPLEQFMLEGIAEDVGLALDAIDERAARELAEHQLAESEARYRAFFERASDAIFVADSQHRYVEVNPAGCRLLGYARDELVGLHLRDVIPPEDLVNQPIATERYEANEPFVIERRLLRKDGRIVEVEISGIKFNDGSLQSVVRDISERKRLLAERAANERITSLGRLAQGVGHEINNPLAYLVLSIDHLRLLLAAGGGSRDLTDHSDIEITGTIDTIAEAAARIASIVKSLSSFGRGESETIGPVSLARAVQAAIAISANRVNHVARMRADLGALPDVRANEFQLTQVFVNLLLNAADAIAEVAPGAHEIRVNAWVEASSVVVEVSDTGPGVAPQLRRRLFEPYVTTKSIGRGTGLGHRAYELAVSSCRRAIMVDEIKAFGYAAQAADAPLAPFSFHHRPVGQADVRIAIEFCGVCHSDLHQVRNEWGGSIYPMVPGHEIIGRVTEVGAKVAGFAVGDRVGVGCMVGSCRGCGSCENHEEQHCEKGTIFTYNSRFPDGSPTFGGYADTIVVDQHFVLRVPEGLDAARAAPLLCAGITTWSPLRRWKVGPGKKVGVVGLGGLGHMGVKFARALGAHVTVFTTSPGKVEDAKALGAHDVIVTRDPKVFGTIGPRFDFILDTVSGEHDLNAYLSTLKTGGAMVLVGLPEKPPTIYPGLLILSRRELAGSLIGGIRETQEMLDFCGEHQIGADIELIPIDAINTAYERMLKNDVKYRFVIDLATLVP